MLRRGFRLIGAGSAIPRGRVHGTSVVPSTDAVERAVVADSLGPRRVVRNSDCQVDGGLTLQGRSASRELIAVVLLCR